VNTASEGPPTPPEGPYEDIEALVRATYEECHRVAFRILGRNVDAEDATQNGPSKLTGMSSLLDNFE
jgi:hypothetical protein